MRLLHTNTLEFTEFLDDTHIPAYAILSHRWSSDEVSYKEFRKGTAKEGTGLAKIHRCCSLALEQGYEWVWIDTCCIDKRSSAELSEAIKPMYRWYKKSAVCYVYMSDVSIKAAKFKNMFRRSTWFTRSWTLQELIAPQILAFYDESWAKFYPKLFDIMQITGIPQAILCKSMPPSSYSIAQRMCWASQRQATRGEDKAYSLLGMFDINMPLLYGEGAQKAFLRLQLEIMRLSKDETIFAWRAGPFDSNFTGLLAPQPIYFAQSSNIMTCGNVRPPYNMTNKGIQFVEPALPRLHMSFESPSGYRNMHLECVEGEAEELLALKVTLNRSPETGERFHENGSLAEPQETYRLEQHVEDMRNTEVIYFPQEGLNIGLN